MITVEFREILSGTCVWCGKEKDEVIALAFSDKSFSGAMCFADFRKALRMKLGAGHTEPIQKPQVALAPKESQLSNPPQGQVRP